MGRIEIPFIGRKQELRQLEDHLFFAGDPSMRDNVQINGMHTIGKTWLIQRAIDLFEERGSQNTVVVYVTLQSIAVEDESAVSANYLKFWEACLKRILKHPLIKGQGWALEHAEEFKKAKKAYIEEGRISDFDTAIEEVLSIFEEGGENGLSFILAIDEFDIAPIFFNAGYIGNLRAYIDSSDLYPLRLAIISRRNAVDITAEMAKGSSPFHNKFSNCTIPLVGFGNDELDEFFACVESQMGGDSFQERMKDIYYLGGRSPGLLSTIVNILNSDPEKVDFSVESTYQAIRKTIASIGKMQTMVESILCPQAVTNESEQKTLIAAGYLIKRKEKGEPGYERFLDYLDPKKELPPFLTVSEGFADSIRQEHDKHFDSVNKLKQKSECLLRALIRSYYEWKYPDNWREEANRRALELYDFLRNKQEAIIRDDEKNRSLERRRKISAEDIEDNNCGYINTLSLKDLGRMIAEDYGPWGSYYCDFFPEFTNVELCSRDPKVNFFEELMEFRNPEDHTNRYLVPPEFLERVQARFEKICRNVAPRLKEVLEERGTVYGFVKEYLN